MTVRRDRWGRRMWWAGPAVVGAIGALSVAGIVAGPELADSVAVPNTVNVGTRADLSASKVTASHAPPVTVRTTTQPRTSTRTTPAPRPMSTEQDTTSGSSSPTSGATQVVPPQRPVVEREAPDDHETPQPGDSWQPDDDGGTSGDHGGEIEVGDG